MARTPLTRTQRATNVKAAAADLMALIERAEQAERDHGSNDQVAVQRAWEAVEINGATVHRQARLLAGKSRGG